MVSVRDVTLSYCKRFGYFLTCYACHTCCATPYSTCLDLWNECDLNVNWLCHFQCSLWLFQWPLACYLFWWHMQNCANTLINAVIILPVTSIVNLVPRSWHCVLGTLRSRSEAWHTEQEAITGKKISQSLQQQWGALPFSQPEVLEEDLSLAAFVRISQHGMEITEKVFWVPGWSEDLRGSFTATIFLWLKQSYLCHLESLMVMTFSFYPRVSQKTCLMNDSAIFYWKIVFCVLQRLFSL